MSSALKSHHNESVAKKQSTWRRGDEKWKNWRKGANVKQSVRKNKTTSTLEQKSDVTRSGRLSDGTSNYTGSSSEPSMNFRRLQDVVDLDEKESIQKCLKWMETLPEKFSGMHVYVQPQEIDRRDGNS